MSKGLPQALGSQTIKFASTNKKNGLLPLKNRSKKFASIFSKMDDIRYLAADYSIFNVFTMPLVITLWYYLCHHK